MVIDWSLPFTLETPFADLDFNASDGIGMKLVPELCVARYSVRSTKDNVPQGDGSELHFRFKTGYEIGMTAELWATKDLIACDTDITTLGEALDGALSSLLNPPDQAGRLKWAPSGTGTMPGARMFDDLALLESPVATMQAGGAIRVQWVLDTQWPYAIDQAEQDIDVNGTVVIGMEGTADYYPVIKVFAGGSPLSNFIISNVTQGKALSYDGTAIPTGEYLEIDTFKNTAFLNGDQANYLNGFDPELTDFFTLSPGDNQIDTNCQTTFLTNNAWA